MLVGKSRNLKIKKGQVIRVWLGRDYCGNRCECNKKELQSYRVEF
jgi:hypothetical protein